MADRTNILSVRFTDDEIERIKTAAAAEDRPAAYFVRMAALKEADRRLARRKPA